MSQVASAKEKWERDQAKLRSQVEGTADPSEIVIPPPRDPEVNPEIYKDVIPLLSRGFLMSSAEINDVPFVFKSLNHHEFELLSLMGGLHQDRATTQSFCNRFLAYGVFMVDGINVLSNRERNVRDIARTFEEFNPASKSKLIRNLSELNRRASVATLLTEAYVTESYSRYRWAQVGGLDLMAPTVTGIDGTEKLGLNFAQLTWRALNHYEDLRDQMEREWENAKFVGACMAGKGIQKVHSSDERRRAKHKELLLSRKDGVIRNALFGEPIDDGTSLKDGRVMVSARTTEELSAQLQASLRGEKDWHDTIVEDYEKQIADRYKDQQEKLQEVLENHKNEFGDRHVVGSTDMGSDLKGLTPAEVQQRITRKKQVDAQQIAQRVVYPQLNESSEITGRKWGLIDTHQTKITPTDRDPTNATPFAPPTPRGRPFRR